MLKPSTKRKIRRIIAPFRRIGLKKRFTIISNNCWGGIAYDKFGLKYSSPTVGLLFKPSDFLKYVTNLKYYLSIKPTPILERQIRENEHQGLYAAKVDDITIFFIHYKNVYEAIDKYEKRKERIVWDNIIVKFSDLTYDGESCNESILESIFNLPFKKIVFTKNSEFAKKYDCAYLFSKTNSDGDIKDEFKQANHIFPLNKLKKIINK